MGTCANCYATFSLWHLVNIFISTEILVKDSINDLFRTKSYDNDNNKKFWTQGLIYYAEQVAVFIFYPALDFDYHVDKTIRLSNEQKHDIRDYFTSADGNF